MVRLKHRYLLVNILYPDAQPAHNTAGLEDVPYTVQLHQPTTDAMDARLLTKIIRQGVSDLFGDYGSGMIAGSLQVKYFSPATSTAIIRVSRDYYRLVWAALTFTSRLPKPVDQTCVVQVVRVSGTIKKAEEEAIRRARLSIKQARFGNGQMNAKARALEKALKSTREATDAPLNQIVSVEDPVEPDDDEVDENGDDDG